jgi:hypothetical protein
MTDNKSTKATSQSKSIWDKEMTFDYGLPAELFIAKRKGGARSRLISRRFATAAEAIRFAIEDFPAIRTLGAWMQVGDERFNGDDIDRLYQRHDFPLRRPID